MTALRDLIFLTQRIPYPPDKGDKIRSFHILKRLAQEYRVHLGCFIDDPHDEQYAPRLNEFCASTLCLSLRKPQALAQGMLNMARGRSLSEGYFHAPQMARWIEDTLAHTKAGNIFVFCSSMAPYAFAHKKQCRIVMDMVDVDSEKWRGYADTARWPLTALYAREARALLAAERKAVLAFDASFLISPAEVALFVQRAPECAGRVGSFTNGVDCDYFDPALDFPDPYPAGGDAVVFTGTMNYEPNARAAVWFTENVMPELRRRRPQAEFWIVGANPAPAVTRLAEHDGVHVTGRVGDMRPYLRHAACAVAPLQIARGLQNKIVEAMAMDLTVIASEQAWQGLTALPGKELFLADTPSSFATTVLDVLEGRRAAQGARARILADHQWPKNLDILAGQIAGGSPARSPCAVSA